MLWGYPALVSASPGGVIRGLPLLRDVAIEMLVSAGPNASSAVPDLIELLSNFSWDADIGGKASQALKAITGQDFGMDPEAWRRWWEEQL